MSLTERIDNLLEERKISRRQLAIMAHIPPSSLQSAMSRGKNMTVEMLQAIAEALDVPVSYLQDESNCIDSNLQRRVLAKVQERISKSVHGADPADLYEVLGTTNTEKYFRDIYEGIIPLTEERLIDIADSLGTSVEYLLGFVGDKGPIQTTCRFTGLTKEAVKYIRSLYELRYLPGGNQGLSMLNAMMSNQNSLQFDTLLNCCIRYVNMASTPVSDTFWTTPDYTVGQSNAEEHGYRLYPIPEHAQVVFWGEIVELMRALLDNLAKHQKQEGGSLNAFDQEEDN